MTDLQTKPRSGRLLNSTAYTALIDNYLDMGHSNYETHRDFAQSRGDRLADHERAMVTRMRVPFAPYYDTTFILKWFQGEGFPEVASEKVDKEAASLHHAAEAFQRNNIGRVPRVYACRPQDRYIAMERIRGRTYRHRDSRPYLWPKESMIRFVRQMAAIRLAMMTQVENQLGVPREAPDGGRVGPHCGPEWCENDRIMVWGLPVRGPFRNRHEMVLGCLSRELGMVRFMQSTHKQFPSISHFRTWPEMREYLRQTIRNFEAVPPPANPEFFSLNHNDLQRGFNIMMRGSKIAGVIDWETASYDPLPQCIGDLATSSDFNPRLWREHAGPNGERFHMLPYRMQRDTTQEQLTGATAAGAEVKPFPDWELIENHGGPLGEEDFCGDCYPEDISSCDDESMADPVEIFCDSDAELDDNTPVGTRRLEHDWYYQPVHALIKEFIHHQRGEGVGPDGEWGKLPEEYSRPLADWEDPLFWRITNLLFEGRSDQIVGRDRVGEGVVAKALRPEDQIAEMGKRGRRQPPPRQRRAPTLLGGWGNTTPPEVTEGVPSEAPVAPHGLTRVQAVRDRMFARIVQQSRALIMKRRSSKSGADG